MSNPKRNLPILPPVTEASKDRLTTPRALVVQAIALLATGRPKKVVGELLGLDHRTIGRIETAYQVEIDEIALSTGIANKAWRFREYNAIVETRRDENGVIRSRKDAVDIMRLAAEEKGDIGREPIAAQAIQFNVTIVTPDPRPPAPEPTPT